MNLTFVGWIGYAGAGAAVALLLAQLLFGARVIANGALSIGLAALAAEAVFGSQSLGTSNAESAARWQAYAQGTLAVWPGAWLVFALTYARGNGREFLRRWHGALLVAIIVPLLCAPFAISQGIGSLITEGTPVQWRYAVRWPTFVIQAACLIAAVAGLVNLEWTFRASVGTVRWRLKFAIIGFVLLFVARIYTSTQALLHSASGVALGLGVINSTALVISCALAAVSLVRSRLEAIGLYPSTSVIYRSLTTGLVGLYLILVGVLAEWVFAKGGDLAFPLKALFLILALAGLGLLALSDRLRQRLRLLVSRHFARPLHDYRQVWATFTERTAAALMRQEDYCQAVARLVSETFDLLSVTVWLDQEGTGLLEPGASTAAAGEKPETGEAPALTQMRRELVAQPLPVNIDTARNDWSEVLRRLNPGRFPHGGFRFAVPLVSGGEFVGLIVVGDRVSGLAFTADDVDLLKCIGDQVAANLRNLRLSGRVAELREFEAFQLLSTFLVHDLKNTASTLWLMLRNMRTHFDNPAFREDALRGLGKSVDRINDLIARLTTLREQPIARRVLADLNGILTAAAAKLEGQSELRISKQFDALPRFLLDPQQIESVFTNLVFNARDAVGQGGAITLSSRRVDHWAVAAVEDNGCGMSSEFIARSLFRPFQTTKTKGLGIGMFQSKLLVEAHGGRIEVQTAPGKGTTFRVFLPLMTEENKTPHETQAAHR